MNTSSLSSCIARWRSVTFALISGITIVSCRGLGGRSQRRRGWQDEPVWVKLRPTPLSAATTERYRW